MTSAHLPDSGDLMPDDERMPAWMRAVGATLRGLSDRDRSIVLERVIRTDDRRPPTLQQLGDRFGLSREGIRQIELRAIERLRELPKSDRAVAQLCDTIRSKLGPVFSANSLVAVAGLPMEAEEGPRRGVPPELGLALFLAGPYEVRGSTFVTPGLEEQVHHLVRTTASGPVPLSQVRAKMSDLGIRDRHHMELLSQAAGIRILGEQVIPWTGSLADKAEVVLAIEQRLMSADELHGIIGEGSILTLKNYLGSDPRFRRRGPRTWGLPEWGGETYDGIVVEMRGELEGLERGMPVERLKRKLREKFGISPASVEIMSSTHPTFVREGQWVRLRGTDEPYVPDTALEESQDCVLVDGQWALRHRVTADTLRGSGLAIPEAFAAHLGALPGGRRVFTSDVGAISVAWPAQHPAIGSLRMAGEQLEAEPGDYLFVIPVADAMVIRRARPGALATADPQIRLLALLGQRDAEDEWVAACARAIGLRAHAHVDEIDDLLEVRGDREVLRLFRTASRTSNDN